MARILLFMGMSSIGDPMRKRMQEKQANDIGYLSKFMSGLQGDQERLREIQSVYDNLTLLGQLLCAGTDITGMRADFNNLAGVLLDQLARELRKKAVLSLRSSARIAIDILIRNLFERTADIGFLATDSDIRSFAQSREEGREGAERLKARFGEYVRKYSVYHNIILLAPDGTILVELDGDNVGKVSGDPLVAASLKTEQPYVETFRQTDLLPGESSPLIYSYRVMSEDGSRPVGVLCLCFRFEDECRRIFRSLVGEDDWTVITILDQDGCIIASSDIYQFPVGARLERAVGDECRIVRFAGREYLATTHETGGYQGYMGPGWTGHALAPLNHAFDMALAHELEHVPEAILEGVLETATLFSNELRDIPVRAASIQRELNRAVWNGNVWLSRDNYALNTSFAKVLLWEIGSTGVKTRNVFSRSTTNLYETVVSSVLYDCASMAALAMDIMDRNLYERANDCRWWALTSAFGEVLGGTVDEADRCRLSAILKDINGLYTVYSNLLLFDASASITAVSNPAYNSLIGQTLQADWVRETLGLADTQSYCVSAFEPSPLYGNRHTYIYSAAIRKNGHPVGGVAIVFDATPQFVAMLRDALPRSEEGGIVEGAFAVFTERDGRVIASTEASLCAGTRLEIGREFFSLDRGAGCSNIIEFRDRYYAVGSRMSAGYREYKSETDSYRNEVVALVFVPLSEKLLFPEDRHSLRTMAKDSYAMRRANGEESVEIATFYIGRGWYGIRSSFVIEAIEGQFVTPLPGMPEWVKGCIMYREQAITVFDLSGFLPGETRSGKSGQIVVIRIPEQRASFGILVDELGDIPEIASSRIEPVPAMMAGSLTESLVKPHAEDAEKRILIILSAESIRQRLAGLNVIESLPGRILAGN